MTKSAPARLDWSPKGDVKGLLKEPCAEKYTSSGPLAWAPGPLVA